MATITPRADSARNNPVFQALQNFRLSTSSPLGSTGIDAVHEILPMIRSLALTLEMGHRKNNDGESALEDLNPEILAEAFAGIGYLAAVAAFHAEGL